MKKKIIAYVVSAVMVLTMVPATAFAQVADADDSGMSKTAPDQLTQDQQEAITALEEDIDLLDYDTAGSTEVQSIVNDYVAKIKAATIATDVQALYNEAKTKVNAIKTAKRIIDEYFPEGKKISDYDVDGRTDIRAFKEDATAALDDAETNADVDTIIADLKAKVDAVPDRDGNESSNLAAQLEKYNTQLDNAVSELAYPGATYSATDQGIIDAYIAGAKSDLLAQKTVPELDVEFGLEWDELSVVIDGLKTEGQKAYETALDTAVRDCETYVNPRDYDGTPVTEGGTSYRAQVEGIMDDVESVYFAGYDYSGIPAYNKAVRDKTVKTTSDIDDVVTEIKDDIALIPTSAQTKNDAIYKEFDYAVEVVAKDAYNNKYNYEELLALNKQLRAFWKSGADDAADGKKVKKGNLFREIREQYDAYQQDRVDNMCYGTLEYVWVNWGAIASGTYENPIDADNYPTYIALLDEIDAEKDKYIKTPVKVPDYASDDNWNNWHGNGSTDGYIDWYFKDCIEPQTLKIDAFIDSVYDSDDNEYLIPTAEEIAKAGFDWRLWINAMTVADDAFKKLSDTMKKDPAADTYWTNDITLAEAIAAYNTAKDALKAEEAAADAVEILIGRIPAEPFMNITDKEAVDAATDAYNALSDYGKGLLSDIYGKLVQAQEDIVYVYMEEAGKAAKNAGISETNNHWEKLTATLVDYVETIEGMQEDYDVYIAYEGMPADYTHLDSSYAWYNGPVGSSNEYPSSDYSAASRVAKIIKDIPKDPAEATEEHFDAVKQARAAYDALLTDEAKIEFKRAGYLEWLERYEAAMAPIEDAKDLANATVTILGPFVEGGLPYVARGTTPEVQVTDANGDVIPESAYTVDCNEAHPAGKTSLIIRSNDGSGYTGQNEAAYVVVNNKKNIKSLTGAKKSFTVKYSDYSKHGCTGTEIAWRTANGDWKYSKITSNKASKKITVKAAGKKYVKVRAIVKVDGVRYYGEWSKAKAVTVK